MKLNSTSLNKINGDEIHNKFIKQKIFLILNNINNLFPYKNIDKSLEIKQFNIKNLKHFWEKLYIKNSPSRMLSDLFWLYLPWKLLKKELKNINILDLGCGNGKYATKLLDFSNNIINSYQGIDIYNYKEWDSFKKNKKIKFYKYNGKSILKYIPEDTNFIISQSAIEHFKEDILYFKEIKKFIDINKKNVLQIHLFPSSYCLKLYLWHGFRQYTPRTLSRITKIFNNNSYYLLYKLGGKECNKLHYEWITKPIFIDKVGDLRDQNSSDYNYKLLNAIKKDVLNDIQEVSFYALVIHSNFNNKIF